MQCICPQCNETLTFAETAPKFCSNCGQPLGSSKGSTVEYAPDVVTLAPSVDPEAATLAPRRARPPQPRLGPKSSAATSCSGRSVAAAWGLSTRRRTRIPAATSL